MLLRHINRHPCDVFLGMCVLKYDINRAGGVLPVVNDEHRVSGEQGATKRVHPKKRDKK